MSGKLLLDLLQVEKLGRGLGDGGESGFELLAVFFEFLDMFVFELVDHHLLLFLGLSEEVVPVLVELLVLQDMGLFHFLSFLCLLQLHLLSL